MDKIFYTTKNYNNPVIKSHNDNVFDEVFVNDCYEIKKLNSKYDLLIDVGSNIGLVTHLFFTEKKCSKSYCIEIDKRFQDCHKDLLMGKEYSKDVELYLSKASNKNGDDEIDICDIIENNKNKKIFLKMDIEGHEYPILDSLIERGLFKHIDDFVFELHELPKEYQNTEYEKYDWGENIYNNFKNNKQKLDVLVSIIENQYGKKITVGIFELGKNYNYILGTIKSY